jgi:hypothetical protein
MMPSIENLVVIGARSPVVADGRVFFGFNAHRVTTAPERMVVFEAA